MPSPDGSSGLRPRELRCCRRLAYHRRELPDRCHGIPARWRRVQGTGRAARRAGEAAPGFRPVPHHETDDVRARPWASRLRYPYGEGDRGPAAGQPVPVLGAGPRDREQSAVPAATSHTMIVTGRHLPRRTFLRGMGALIALPALDAMTPAFAAVGSAMGRFGGASAMRLAFTYVPNGVTMADWRPSAAGTAFEFTRILKPLEPFRDDTLLLSGLAHKNGNALGDGPGDHARAAASYLTGVHPRKTAGAD